MNKRIKNKRLTIRTNKFDKGSWKNNWKGDNLGGSISSVVSGAGNVATTAIDLAQPEQLTGQTRLDSYATQREAIENQNTNASTMTDLNSMISNLNWANPDDINTYFSKTEAGGKTAGQLATGIIGAGAAGASAGSMFGHWGTLGGLITGGVLAGVNAGFNQADAKKQAGLYSLQAQSEKKLWEQANQELKSNIFNTRDNIAQNNYNNFMINKIAYGGDLNLSGDFSNGLVFIDEGGTHEQNPFEGVQVGVDREGVPNLVEEGEIIFNDYVFSNRLSPTKNLLEDGGFSDKYNDWTFAKIAEDLQKESSERPNDLISMNGLNDMMARLITMQEAVREKKKTNSYSRGGKVNKFDGETNSVLDRYPVYNPDVSEIEIYGEDDFIIPDDFTPLKIENDVPFLTDSGKAIKPKNAKFILNDDGDIVFDSRDSSYFNKFDRSTLGRYAPVLSNLVSGIWNAVEEPDTLDYGHYDTAFDYAKNIPVATYDPIGGKVTPDLMDPRYLLNQHAAERAALRRAIRENAITGSQAMMHLANADYNAQRNDADALLAFDRENWSRKLQAAQHNFGIDTTNLQAGLQTLGMNQTRAQQIVNAAFQRAGARAGIDQFNLASEAQKGQALSGSMGAFSEDLAGIATENYWRKQIEENPAFMEYIANMNKAKTVAKNGGMLTKKRRK